LFITFRTNFQKGSAMMSPQVIGAVVVVVVMIVTVLGSYFGG
jgi:hypothetical protein